LAQTPSIKWALYFYICGYVDSPQKVRRVLSNVPSSSLSREGLKSAFYGPFSSSTWCVSISAPKELVCCPFGGLSLSPNVKRFFLSYLTLIEHLEGFVVRWKNISYSQ
jgi:hypothetical protein